MVESILRFLYSGKKRFSLRIDGKYLEASLDKSDAEGWQDQLEATFPKVGVKVIKARRGLRR
jgi:hypothetical protein